MKNKQNKGHQNYCLRDKLDIAHQQFMNSELGKDLRLLPDPDLSLEDFIKDMSDIEEPISAKIYEGRNNR